MRLTTPFLLLSLSMLSCAPTSNTHQPFILHNHQLFWESLQSLCGNSYEGKLVAGPANDTVFTNKKLLMHVRSCNDKEVRIPFIVGDDLSRTWVFQKHFDVISLQHDHRHRDGTEDSINFYGGRTTNQGTKSVQFFPADQYTVNQIPAAAGNVWWVEIVPGQYFTYNLRRMGTDRYFSIRFDLTRTVPSPGLPWGWKK